MWRHVAIAPAVGIHRATLPTLAKCGRPLRPSCADGSDRGLIAAYSLCSSSASQPLSRRPYEGRSGRPWSASPRIAFACCIAANDVKGQEPAAVQKTRRPDAYVVFKSNWGDMRIQEMDRLYGPLCYRCLSVLAWATMNLFNAFTRGTSLSASRVTRYQP